MGIGDRFKTKLIPCTSIRPLFNLNDLGISEYLKTMASMSKENSIAFMEEVTRDIRLIVRIEIYTYTSGLNEKDFFGKLDTSADGQMNMWRD